MVAHISRWVCLVACYGGLGLGLLFGQASVLTWHNDNARTGQNLQETILTPANVKVSTFGRLFVIGVDGKVDAQPLYVPSVTIPGQGVHNVLYVETEHDSAYAFDADNGALLKHVSLLPNGETPSDSRGCGQVSPEMGITSTPVIDPQSGPHGTIYLVTMSKDGSGKYHHRLHALDLTTLAEEFSGPAEITATYPGTGDESAAGTLTFKPEQHKERPGLLLSNGVVYTTWGSHCDARPYTGWVMGYAETTLQQVSVRNLTPNGNEGGIWAAGAGPAADASGNLYLLAGNGTFDTALTPGGFPTMDNYGNAFVKMSPGGATLAVTDYFTMFNTTSESGADEDLGSGGLMLLPPLNNSQGQPVSLAVGAGKDAKAYIVNTGNMGKFNPATNNTYQTLTLGGSVYSSPAWFNGKLYYGAVSDALKAFSFSNGAFSTIPVSQSSRTFPYPGTTPSISANGTSNAVVWAAENSSPAVLHAYDANNLSNELYNSNQAPSARDNFGAGNKYIVPTVVNGKVYVGTTNGIGVFGLLQENVPATMSSPTPGSTLAGASATFQWTAGSGVSQYWLYISKKAAGSNDVFDSGGINLLSETVNTLPTDGSTLYVTLYSLIGSTWTFNSYTYKAFTSVASSPAVMSSPAPGSTLSGASATFQWTAGSGVSQNWLYISDKAAGSNDVFDSGGINLLSETVNTLPTDGSTLYVTLYSLIGSNWLFNVYTYKAATSVASSPAAMSSPAPGSTLPGASATFQWTTGSGVSQYWLYISKVSAGSHDIFDSGGINLLSQTVNSLPTDGSTLYVTLYSLIGSNWQFSVYTYQAFH